MATCKECSSEINDNDAFCPYCGIAIIAAEEPVAEDTVSTPDLMDSTIVISRDEFANFSGLSLPNEQNTADESPSSNDDSHSVAEETAVVEPISEPLNTSEETGSEQTIDSNGQVSIDDLPAENVESNESEWDDTKFESDEFEAPLPDILRDEAVAEEPVLSIEDESENISAANTENDLNTESPTESESVAEQEVSIAEDPFTVDEPVSLAEETEEKFDFPIVSEPASENLITSEIEPEPEATYEEPQDQIEETFVEEIETTSEISSEELPLVIEDSAISIIEDSDINSPELSDSGNAESVESLPSVTEPESVAETSAEPIAEVSTNLEKDEAADSAADDWTDLEWEDEPAETDDPIAEPIAAETASEPVSLPVEEKMISMPHEELKPHDPFDGDPTFDSVRIIHNENESPIEPITPGIKAIEPAVSIHAEESVDQPEEQAASASDQNVGKDTDSGSPLKNENDTGKGKSKLKPLPEGVVLNSRYEIIRKIGGGGMGAVYLASDNNLGGVLRAVKEMIQSHIEEEQQDKAVDDFKRESMILSSLDHPSIPTIFDYFYDETESRFYLVMKYISGGDLSTRLRSSADGRIEEEVVTDWAIQIIDVLDYLHSQPAPIVYRDLKPSNIMLDGNSGRVMLIDFGIARSISKKEEKGVTAVGTMGYAPPELFSGNVEPRSDIYSLGSTMFHLLTGADPQSNPLLIFDFQKNPRPRQINPRLSDQMERILMKAVEYNADSRFSSAKEMSQVLTDHLKTLRSGKLSFGVSAVPESVSLANQTVFCGFCGQKIVATDLFCAFCGSKQPIAQQGVQSGIYSGATPTARLLIEGTTELSTPMFSLQKNENLLGRRDPMSNIFPEVDLSKYDPQTKISRRHARIWRDANHFLVEDLGSSNGTTLSSALNESLRLIPHQPQKLNNGDRIIIGDTTMQFVVN